jgi:hypothetical protein
MRGHRKHVILPYNQFKDGSPTGNTLKYLNTQCDSIFAGAGCWSSRNSSPVGGDA